MDVRCFTCHTKDPLFLWMFGDCGRGIFYCFRCTFKCSICGRFADIDYRIDTGVNVSQVSRCNIHLIENCPIESFPGYAPDRIDVEITGRAATTEEKKVFMVMIE
jgi:hypothetical protein